MLFAPRGYWDQISTLLHPTEDYNWNTDYGRRNVWIRGVGYMLDSPLTGLGIGNFPRAEGTISDVAVTFVDRIGHRLKWSAAHNSFLQAGAEMGIPGLLLFSSLVFGGIFSMVKYRRKLAAWSRGDPEQRRQCRLACSRSS